jgi:hypothetical protein
MDSSVNPRPTLGRLPQLASSFGTVPGYSSPCPIAQAGTLSPEFRIFAETTAIRHIEVHSAGPDGAWHTADDLLAPQRPAVWDDCSR